MVKVSVIVPVYNVEKYLDKCLKSLVNQTLKDIEIIIVNDGSPDNSQKIIDKYVKKYPKMIKSIIQENGGVSDARNNGLKYATGEYIVFVDSDDYVEKNMMEELYNKISQSKCDLVICGNHVLNQDYQIISSTYPNNNVYSSNFERALLGNTSPWDKIIKRSLIDKYRLKYRSNVWYEDLDYCFKLFVLSDRIEFVEKNLYNYIIHDNSTMSSKKLNKNNDILLSLDEIIDFAKRESIYERYYEEIEYLAINNIYISAIVRVINADASNKDKKETIKRFIRYVKFNFPKYRKNKYIGKLSQNRKIVFKLINFRMFGLIKLIFKIRKKM